MLVKEATLDETQKRVRMVIISPRVILHNKIQGQVNLATTR